MIKIIMLLIFSIASVFGQISKKSDMITIPLNSTENLELINVQADVVEYKGKQGIEIKKAEGEIDGGTLAIIPNVSFMDGTISVELAGQPAEWAPPQMRGFIGLAFRVDSNDYSRYECFYLRPTNARANNQLRRNHTTQYVSHPEHPWHRLRKESPGLYESYVDMVSGEWTKIKIEVSGNAAKLFVNEDSQPTLIVKDLKHEKSLGKIALWLHSSTLARFRNLVVIPN